MAKYVNLYYGIQLERIEGQKTVFSKNLANLFTRCFTENVAIPATKKAFKEAGLEGLFNSLEVLCARLERVNAFNKPEKGDLLNALKACRQVCLEMGMPIPNAENVYAETWTLATNCMAIVAVGGKNAGVGKVKASNYANFRKAFINAVYQIYIQDSNNVKFYNTSKAYNRVAKNF